MLDPLRNDLRYTLRWLSRSPAFAGAAIISLGLGIGFTAAMFAVVDALLLRPLPVRAPHTLVDLYTSGTADDLYSTSSLPDVQDLRAQAAVFEDIAGHTPMFAAVSAGERARLVLGEIVTGNYFRMLGVRAAVGRTLLPEDDQPGAPRVAVLSAAYWRRQFAADPAITGRELRIKGQVFAVVGVVDEAFTGMVPLLAPEIWIPVHYVEDVEPAGMNSNVPSPTGTSRVDRRGMRWLFAKARLRDGVSASQAQANVNVVAAALATAHPQTNKDLRMTVKPAVETRLHPAADGLLRWLLTGIMLAVAVLLLIVCANVAGMLLARASARKSEIAIRLAVGASGGRLLRQLLTEGVVIAGLGAMVGLAFAWWFTSLLTTFELPLPVPVSIDLQLDVRVLLFTIVITCGAGLLAGLAPALRASRMEPAGDLKAGGGGETGTRRLPARSLLVVGQVAATTSLLVVAGLLLRGVREASFADPGFRTAGVAFVSTDTELLGYSEQQSQQFWSELEHRVRQVPGVEHVALASRFPFSFNFSFYPIAVPGHQASLDEVGATVHGATVSPDYFATLGIPVLEGRVFDQADDATRPRVGLVNAAFARRYWPNESAVGKVVYERRLDSGRPIEVIGVVADHVQQRVGESATPAIFHSLTQRPSAYSVLAARAAGDEAALVQRLREVLLGLEPNAVLMESATMRGQMAATLLPIRIAGGLLTVFAAFGLLLAALGLYGVLAFDVARRTREIGIRMAIGARKCDVLRAVLRQGLGLTSAGLLLGVVMAAATTRLLEGALYKVGLADRLAWGGAVLVVLAVAAAANLVPAQRAMRIDPATALRNE